MRVGKSGLKTTGLGYEQGTGCCEYSNKLRGFPKRGKCYAVTRSFSFLDVSIPLTSEVSCPNIQLGPFLSSVSSNTNNIT
jgi:hypothetical protein